MNHQPNDEQHLLQHVREHSQARPSAQVDERILAAAKAQVTARSPSFWQRLFTASSNVRWSAALGCIAVLGIGLGLSLQTMPPRQDAPATALHAPVSAAQLAMQGEAPKVMARMAAKAVPLSPELEEALRDIARLREQGRTDQARARVEALQRAQPELDIEAQLQRLSTP